MNALPSIIIFNKKQSIKRIIFHIIYSNKMNFNYQLYVNRLKYEPYQWPPDISLAELHSRVSEQGPINHNGVKCPCCNYQSKKKFSNWLMRDIHEDCSKLGSAVPAYFGLLKFYIVAIFLAILINGIYPIWALNYTCQPSNNLPDGQCLKVGILYYLDFDKEITYLARDSNNFDIANNLIILETINYYLLTFVNLGSLWYLFYMEKKEEGLFLQHTQAARNALIVDPIKLKEKLNVETKLEIVEIIPLKQIKIYYELFNKRNGIFYKLLSRYVQSEDPKNEKKLNRTLSQLHKQLKIEKKKIYSQSFTHLIIVFKTSYMATLVYNNYSLSGLQKFRYGTSSLIEEMGITKKMSQLPLYTLKVPSVDEIKWQNVGQNVKRNLAGRIRSFFIAVGIIFFLFLFFEEPLRYSLQTHTRTQLSDIQKLTPIFVSFLLFAVSVVYRNYMVQISKRKNPSNEYQAAKFVLISSMLFHIIFYIIVPVIFFSVDDGIDSTIKLYVISQQARTFVVMQLILCIIDVPYQMWKKRKVKCLADQREGFKYNQQMLHKMVEYRDFPLELRLQVMFRIWSLAMFYSFYLPYMMYYMFVALIILYILEKHNFYLHYTLRRSITLKLEKSFLVYFVNFFCVFQCYAYSKSSFSTKEFDWTTYTAIPITFTLLVLNFVFWIIVQPKLKKEKEREEQGLMEKLLVDKPDKAREQYVTSWAKGVGEEYKDSYDKFLKSIDNQKLDEEIDDYLSTLTDDQIHEDSSQIVLQKIIEMAESEFDEATD